MTSNQILDHVVPPNSNTVNSERFQPPQKSDLPEYASLSSKKGLTFLNLNVRSLLRKIDDVRHLVHIANPEVVAITET